MRLSSTSNTPSNNLTQQYMAEVGYGTYTAGCTMWQPSIVYPICMLSLLEYLAKNEDAYTLVS